MKKILFLIIILSLLMAIPSFARTMYWEQMDVKIFINKDSSVNVEEKQEYVFTGAWNGGLRSVRLKGLDAISNIEVWEGELKYKAGNLDKYGYETYRESGDQVIKWRSRNPDEPEYADTHKTFTIKYKLTGAINYGKKFDEFYWKAVFEDREWIVNNAIVRVYLPEKVGKGELNVTLYSGVEGALWKIVSPTEIYFEGKNLSPENYLK